MYLSNGSIYLSQNQNITCHANFIETADTVQQI